MIRSMTAFASAQGSAEGFSWTWDLRSVNARGLDLRLRIPDWLDGVEATLRPQLAKKLSRGNVSLGLKINQDDAETTAFRVNNAGLQAALDAIAATEQAAMDRGIDLAPSRASDIVALRGVLEQAADAGDRGALVKAVLADFAALLDAFVGMREVEGAALETVLGDQLDRMATLTEQAAASAEVRREAMAETLKVQMARVLDNATGADPDRLAQELALIAVKADITEEIDRLRAHVDAARALLSGGGAVGRKLDFLCQEFNREANTLCSKAQSAALTAIGLELKTVIDQMREQVQNIE